MDADTKAERTIAALPDAQDLKLSPDGSTLAFTRKRPEGAEVVVLSIVDARQRVLTAFPGGDAAANIDSWSPDGRALLLLAGTGTYIDFGPPAARSALRNSYDWSRYVVVDMAGENVWQHPTCAQLCALIRVQWAGPRRLFVGTGGSYDASGGARRTEGYFETLSPPSSSDQVEFNGYVRCFSPSGRYVYWQDGEDHEVVWDLQDNEQVLRVKTGSYTGFCGWTEDETKLVVSSGGV